MQLFLSLTWLVFFPLCVIMMTDKVNIFPSPSFSLSKNNNKFSTAFSKVLASLILSSQ